MGRRRVEIRGGWGAYLCIALLGCSGKAAGSSSSRGGAVYAGCAEPAAAFNHLYYADPVGGSMTNDGSKAHPWGSLSAMVDAGKLPPAAAAVVAPGDAIYLLSGNHGIFAVDNAFNSDFITIESAPGEQATLAGITIYGGSHWVFSGLLIQNLNNGGYTFGARLDLDDVVFTSNVVESQADVSGWAQADWQYNAITGVNASGNQEAFAQPGKNESGSWSGRAA
jgi:hypothetical protein